MSMYLAWTSARRMMVTEITSIAKEPAIMGILIYSK